MHDAIHPPESHRPDDHPPLPSDTIRALYASSLFAFCSLTKEGVFLNLNETALRWLGFGREELLGGRQVKELLTPASQAALRNAKRTLKEAGRVWEGELELLRKDGGRLAARVGILTMRDAMGVIESYECFAQDISLWRRSEMAIQETQRFIDHLLFVSPEIIYVHDLTERRNVFATDRLAAILGYTPTELQGMSEASLMDLTHPEDQETQRRHLKQMREAQDRASYETEYRVRHANGSWRWLRCQDVVYTRTETGDVQQIMGVAQDVTERKESERELREQTDKLKDFALRMAMHRDELEQLNRKLEDLAVTDSLTGVRNRHSFQDRLEQEFLRLRRYKTPFALIMIDVDGFKSYNDAFGHPAGDQALVSIAKALRGCARDSDFLARYGGEEFVAVLPETDDIGALTFAERARAKVAMLHNLRRPLTVSVGVATMPPDLGSCEDMISEADRAMYEAKKQGGNRVAYISRQPPSDESSQ